MSDEDASEISNSIWDTVVEAFQHSNDHSNSIESSKSLLDFFEEKYDNVEIAPWKRQIILQGAHMWGAFVGDPISRQSLKFFFLEECIEGGRW